MTALVPILTANSDKGFIVSASSVYSTHQAFKLFDGASSDSNRYTSNVNPTVTPQWVQIQFPTETVVNAYSLTPFNGTHVESYMPLNWTFSASNTGLFSGEQVVLDAKISEKWTTPYNNSVKEFQFSNKDSYKFYRLTWRDTDRASSKEWTVIGEMQLYNRTVNKILLLSNEKTYSLNKKGSKENVVPKMTSNIAPLGVASASGVTYGQQPYFAFDGNDASYWYVDATHPTGGHWIKYDFGSNNQKAINRIKLKSLLISGSDLYGLKDFILYGSNDDTSYMEVFRGTQLRNSNKQEYVFSNRAKYRYYKLVVPTTYYQLGTVGLNEFEMFEEEGLEVNALPSHSEENFIKYGMKSLDGLNFLSQNKNYILQDTVSENAEGLWATRINRKPLSIKFN